MRLKKISKDIGLIIFLSIIGWLIGYGILLVSPGLPWFGMSIGGIISVLYVLAGRSVE